MAAGELAGSRGRGAASRSLNDYGCPMTAQPTVEHWQSDERDCGRVEPADKDVAVIYEDGFDYDARDRTLPSRSVVIGGAPGTRAEGRIADGRYEAWVLVPTDPPVVVVARTREAAVASRSSTACGWSIPTTTAARGCDRLGRADRRRWRRRAARRSWRCTRPRSRRASTAGPSRVCSGDPGGWSTTPRPPS